MYNDNSNSIYIYISILQETLKLKANCHTSGVSFSATRYTLNTVNIVHLSVKKCQFRLSYDWSSDIVVAVF